MFRLLAMIEANSLDSNNLFLKASTKQMSIEYYSIHEFDNWVLEKIKPGSHYIIERRRISFVSLENKSVLSFT